MRGSLRANSAKWQSDEIASAKPLPGQLPLPGFFDDDQPGQAGRVQPTDRAGAPGGEGERDG